MGQSVVQSEAVYDHASLVRRPSRDGPQSRKQWSGVITSPSLPLYSPRLSERTLISPLLHEPVLPIDIPQVSWVHRYETSFCLLLAPFFPLYHSSLFLRFPRPFPLPTATCCDRVSVCIRYPCIDPARARLRVHASFASCTVGHLSLFFSTSRYLSSGCTFSKNQIYIFVMIT